jgi:hypothetical protein
MENIDKKQRVRSPNYPIVALDKAIELVSALFENQSRYLVPIEAAAKDWGISNKGSYLAQHVATLSSYGLIDTEGEKDSRKIKISELAFQILIDKRPESEQRHAFIKEAALNPDIFRKIYEAYPSGFPAEHTLEYELVSKYKFNQRAVRSFIDIIKTTFTFANVYKSDIMNGKNTSIDKPEMITIDKMPIKDSLPGKMAPPSILDANEREIANYPVGRGLKARILISGASPVTYDSIDKLIRLLQLNKEDLPETIPNEKIEPPEN